MSKINLLQINGYTIPNPKRNNLSLTKDNKYNSYECEDGSVKIEPIRIDNYSGNITFNGLFENDLKNITDNISLVSTLVFYSPYTNSNVEIKALIKNIKSSNIITETDKNAWSLSFSFEELDR